MQAVKIGVYAGLFDPVHSGHISFALEAREAANLREVYFLPERMPGDKKPAEHYAHRVAMIRQAIAPHTNLELAEMQDKRFSVSGTLPRLQNIFNATQMVFLMGAETFISMKDWPNVSRMIESCEFAVSTKDADEVQAVLAVAADLALPSGSLTLLDSTRPDVAAPVVRDALRARQPNAPGVLSSVIRYAKREWLYVSFPKAPKT